MTIKSQKKLEMSKRICYEYSHSKQKSLHKKHPLMLVQDVQYLSSICCKSTTKWFEYINQSQSNHVQHTLSY